MASKTKTGAGRRTSGSNIIETQQRRINELESLLAERDEVITNLQRKLAEQGEQHTSSMKKLRRERDELRTKNATLVNKLAEVSRKRSLTTNNTPPLPRPSRSASYRDSSSRLPSLPSVSPYSTRHHPPTIPHHHSAATLPTRSSPPTTGSPQIKTTPPQGKTITFAVSIDTPDSDTDYSDLEDNETELKPAITKKMSGSENGGAKKELLEVMDSSAVSASPVLLAYSKKNNDDDSRIEIQQPSKSIPISCGERKRQNSGGSSLSSSSSVDSREGSYTINTGADKTSPSPKLASPAQHWSPNSRASQLSSKKFSSSDGVASAIHELLNRKGSAAENGKPPLPSSPKDILSVVSTQAQNGYPVSGEEAKISSSRQDIVSRSRRGTTPPNKSINLKPEERLSGKESVKSETETSDNTSQQKQLKGGVAKTRAMFERMSSNPSMDEPPFRNDRTASVSSDVPSSEGTATDIESSLDVASPPLPNLINTIAEETSPTHSSAGSENPTHLTTEAATPTHPVADKLSPTHLSASTTSPTHLPAGTTSPTHLAANMTSPSHLSIDKSLKGSNVSMPNIMLDRSRMFNSTHHMSVRDDSNLIEEEEELGDTLGDIDNFSPVDVRSRTMTVSGASYKKMEIGRKKMKVHRKENLLMKRATSQVASNGKDFSKDMVTIKHDFELFSPLLEAKIKNMALKKIYDMYGGKATVKSAINVIEQAWQNYSLRKRYLERLKEKSQSRQKMRDRAKSLRQPNRRPSILQKGGRDQYRKAALGKGLASDVKKVASPAMVDPMARTREKAALLGKERLGHTHSGARLELMEKKRSGGGTKEEDRSSLSNGRRSTGGNHGISGSEEVADTVRESTPMEDSVFSEEEKLEEKKKKQLETSLSVTQIEMQFDSTGLEQCKDMDSSQLKKFELGLSSLTKMEEHSSEDEVQDSIQPDGITRKA